MIELHDIYAIILCTLLVLTLITLTVFHRQKAKLWKETEKKLLAEIDMLHRGTNTLPPPSTKNEENKLSARESLLIHQLSETVANNYMNPDFGVDELAKALEISRSSLNRRMRETLNTTTNNYIRDIRIQKAEELLRNSSLQINEICYRVGFQTPSYFIKCFRKKYGQSPNEYANSANHL